MVAVVAELERRGQVQEARLVRASQAMRLARRLNAAVQYAISSGTSNMMRLRSASSEFEAGLGALEAIG